MDGEVLIVLQSLQFSQTKVSTGIGPFYWPYIIFIFKCIQIYIFNNNVNKTK